MTKPKARKPLVASRETDVLVAKALGWFGPIAWVDDEESRDPYMYPPTVLHRDWAADRQAGHEGEHNHVVGWYSSDIRFAWKIAEWIRERGFFLAIEFNYAGAFTVQVFAKGDGQIGTTIGETYAAATVELALCTAVIELAKLPVFLKPAA